MGIPLDYHPPASRSARAGSGAGNGPLFASSAADAIPKPDSTAATNRSSIRRPSQQPNGHPSTGRRVQTARRGGRTPSSLRLSPEHVLFHRAEGRESGTHGLAARSILATSNPSGEPPSEWPTMRQDLADRLDHVYPNRRQRASRNELQRQQWNSRHRPSRSPAYTPRFAPAHPHPLVGEPVREPVREPVTALSRVERQRREVLEPEEMLASALSDLESHAMQVASMRRQERESETRAASALATNPNSANTDADADADADTDTHMPLLRRVGHRSVASARSMHPILDGLGDRDRERTDERRNSYYPEFDSQSDAVDYWNRLLSTIPPDEYLPSASSSFTSATASGPPTLTPTSSFGSSSSAHSRTHIMFDPSPSFGMNCDLVSSSETSDTSDDEDGDDSGHGGSERTGRDSHSQPNNASGPSSSILTSVPTTLPATGARDEGTDEGTDGENSDNNGGGNGDGSQGLQTLHDTLNLLSQRDDIPEQWWASAGLTRLGRQESSRESQRQGEGERRME